MEIPVYLFTGLLESGKTTLIYEVAGEKDFLEPGRTVLVQCEEGESEFSQDFLDKYDMTLVKIDDKEELNKSFWKECEQKYNPVQIMVEYNGMWEMDYFFESGIPDDWFVGGVYSTVNASTAEMYINNMRKTFMEPLKDSNLIIFNRCDDSIDRMKFRRSLKALNPQVQVAFERKDGTIYQNDKDEMPFDYSGEVIEIEDMDYGLWYVDAMDNPDRYMGKEIKFTARYCKSMEPGQKYFVPGRHVMTCCEADIQFLGFVCYFEDFQPQKEMNFEHGEWVNVAVRFFYGECEIYGQGEEGPILNLIGIEKADQPEMELVTFT